MASNSANQVQMMTDEVRFSYANVFVPTAINNQGEPKYNISLLIPKSNKALVTQIKKAIAEATEIGRLNFWGGKIPPKIKLPLRDGDEEKPEEEAYKGMYFLNANSQYQPVIVGTKVNAMGKLIELKDPTEFYSGCYGRALINFYPFDKAGNKGVGVGLGHLQKLRDGERLGTQMADADALFNDDVTQRYATSDGEDTEEMDDIL